MTSIARTSSDSEDKQRRRSQSNAAFTGPDSGYQARTLNVVSAHSELTVLCVDHSHVGSIFPLFCCTSFLPVVKLLWKGPLAEKSCRTRLENWLIVLIKGVLLCHPVSGRPQSPQ